MDTQEAQDGERRAHYARVLGEVVNAAFAADGFASLCALLRVGGMSDANWDPFEESREAFDDYNWMLSSVGAARGARAARRTRLLMYCQAVEMSAPQEILANLLRCAAKRSYTVDPFIDLGRRKKKDPWAWIPPSASMKFRHLKELSEAAKIESLSDAIDTVFDERVRNAFSHSDYVITDEQFRFSEGRLVQQIPVEQLDRLVDEGFAFYGAFLMLHREWLRQAARMKKFHQWPNYEVLELLSSADEGVYGFHVHFSNGTRATYTRRKEGIEAINLVFQQDGGIGFQVGDLGALTKAWKINGRPVDDWSALP
ncbi:MAG TPA: hypothetical protein VEA99_03510 [Gemmatimonadaceae bacterium]|nr:hypothetical protein [Gemmatimonadaceae bacterium]